MHQAAKCIRYALVSIHYFHHHNLSHHHCISDYQNFAFITNICQWLMVFILQVFSCRTQDLLTFHEFWLLPRETHDSGLCLNELSSTRQHNNCCWYETDCYFCTPSNDVLLHIIWRWELLLKRKCPCLSFSCTKRILLSEAWRRILALVTGLFSVNDWSLLTPKHSLN